MGDNQDLVNSLKDIKAAALGLLVRLQSDDPGAAQAAMQEYSALVDRFYHIESEHLAPQQYVEAKKDIEYFMRLVDLAVAYNSDGMDGGKESVGQNV